MGKYKQLFALITPFETLIDSDRNLYNPGPIISQGFVWSHWSITMPIFPRKFPLKDWFLGSKHFPCSFWICQSIPLFNKFSSCDVISSLYYSLNSWNLIVKGIHHAHVTSAIRMIMDYLKPKNISFPQCLKYILFFNRYGCVQCLYCLCDRRSSCTIWP